MLKTIKQFFQGRRSGKQKRGPATRNLGIEALEERQLLAQTVGLFTNSTQAYEGYTLFAPSAGTETFLIDNDGKEINRWNSEFPPMSSYLLEDGSLLRVGRMPNGFFAPGAAGRVELQDWEGNRIWQYTLNNANFRLHHDIEPLFDEDGNLSSVLMIAWERLSRQEALALGRDPDLPFDNNGELWPDMVIEVKPDFEGGFGGETIWEWRLSDHSTNQPSQHPELVDINYVPTGTGAGGVLADWTHFNGIDYNPELDQILLSAREFSEFWIIDHSTTTAEAASHSGGKSGMGGDLLYRWGNPAAYGQGTRANQKLFYQHDARWIEPGLPGEGNITVFNNGWNRQGGANYSSVIELSPPLSHQWFLNNRTDGSSSAVVVFDWLSDVPSTWAPLTGDWDDDGSDSGGFYNPATQRWHLNNSTDGSFSGVSFDTTQLGADASWIPLAGDWNNDGYDTAGLYDPNTNNWYLSNALDSWGEVTTILAPVNVGSALIPLAGNWDGLGGDSVGLYDPAKNRWVLNNKIDGSINDLIVFQIATPLPTWKPVVGDWNGNGRDTAGLYNQEAHRWVLNNKTDGSANDLIVINAPPVPANWRPLTGDWNGNGTDTVGLYNPKYVEGNYASLPGKAYGPQDTVWEYTAQPRSNFFATIISGAQRLPNGNTLINEGTEGRFFEVNPNGQIVWSYKNPIVPGNDGMGRALFQGTPVDPSNIGIPGVFQNLVFRAERYSLDYLDPSLDLTPGGPIERYPNYFDTVGLYDANSFDWYLNNHLDGTITDVVQFNTGITGTVAIAGNWNNDGLDTVGLYNPATQRWHLNNSTDGSFSGVSFDTTQLGADASWIPLAGDWNNDGYDTAGLYDPNTNNWYLSNALDSWGEVTTILAPVNVGSALIPLAGNWDGLGGDSVGLYDPAKNRWVLNNKIDGSINDLIVFQIATPLPTWKPVVGDWNGNGRDTAGLYSQEAHRWVLNNKTDGSVNDLVVLNTPGLPASAIPVTGNWNGVGTSTPTVSGGNLLASWQGHIGEQNFTTTAETSPDLDKDQDVDGNDFLVWQRSQGKAAVTEAQDTPVKIALNVQTAENEREEYVPSETIDNYVVELATQEQATLITLPAVAAQGSEDDADIPTMEASSQSLLVSAAAVANENPQLFASSRSQTLGLTINNPAKSLEGYTVLGPLRSTDTYLIDNTGNVVHTWESDFRPNANYLLEDGTLLRTAQLPGLTWGAGGSSGRVELLDWNSNVIWSYELATNKYLLHHDIAPVTNPDGSLRSVLMIVWHKMTRQEAEAVGRSPNSPFDATNNGELWSERIIEVVPDWNTGQGGTIVWDWYLKDHVVANNVAAHPELVDINFEPVEGNASTLADWAHLNAIDYNPVTDQIMLSSRDFSELWVLDHSTTTAEAASHSGGKSGMGGDLLYRWGNPAAYGQGTRANQKLFHQHNTQWIPPGLPGEGNILIFNNGSFRPNGSEFSSVIELSPPLSHQWFLNNRTDGSSSAVVVFDWLSDVPSTWAPLTGDWDDDGSDSGGFYNPATQRWHLNNSTDGSFSGVSFDTTQLGADASWIPLAGDWNNDGYDTAGLYDPNTNNWYLSNALDSWGEVTTILAPVNVGSALIPLAGNWDGLGGDSVGLYDPAKNRWVLNNKIDGSINDLIVFQIATPLPTWKPVVGDWNGNGRDTAGLYNQEAHRWVLNNKTDGSANDLIVINAPPVPANWRPLTGDWNGNGTDTVGLYNPKYVEGNYASLPGKAYGPQDTVWEYTAQPRSSFYSSIISGVQRLPNGNTLVDEGVTGRLFEVTTSGEIVWEYINPVTNVGPLAQGETPPELAPGSGNQANLVFRALRYPLDYPGLDGQQLTPGGPIERYPNYFDTVGLYDANSFDWYLNNHLDGTITDVVQFNTGITGTVAIAGNWNNDGLDTVGLYNPATQRWHLNNSTDGSFSGVSFDTTQLGADASWIPLAGDWNNDGYDTAGLYDPNTNNWYLSNALDSWGEVTTILAPVNVGSALIPLAGNWDGLGGDSVGLYDPAKNRWVLNNKIDGSINDLIVFQIATPLPTWKPVVGDWNGNGRDTAGLYSQEAHRWVLNNKTDGSVNDLVVLNTPGLPASAIPVTGNWNGVGTSTPTVSGGNLLASWQGHIGEQNFTTTAETSPDLDKDQDVDGNDFLVWQRSQGDTTDKVAELTNQLPGNNRPAALKELDSAHLTEVVWLGAAYQQRSFNSLVNRSAAFDEYAADAATPSSEAIFDPMDTLAEQTLQRAQHDQRASGDQVANESTLPDETTELNRLDILFDRLGTA